MMDPVVAVVVLAVWLGIAGLLIIPAGDFTLRAVRKLRARKQREGKVS